MDEPTAALGVKETEQVHELIERARERGLPVILVRVRPEPWHVRG
jgi:fructose transport system ATP-binding protein